MTNENIVEGPKIKIWDQHYKESDEEWHKFWACDCTLKEEVFFLWEEDEEVGRTWIEDAWIFGESWIGIFRIQQWFF